MTTRKKSSSPDSRIHVKIVCPWWGRYEVTKMHCKSMVKFMQESPYKMSYLAIVSPDDKDFHELCELAFSNSFDVCAHENYPVSAKLNAGIELAMDDKPDYIMNMGSDDLCSSDIWEFYTPLIQKGIRFFGIDSCHIVDFYTNEAFFLDLYNNNEPVGVLRMIHTSAIRDLWTDCNMKLYPYGINRGMDGASMVRLRKIGLIPSVVNTNGRVFTTGVKCHTSINQFIHLTMLDQAKPVEFDSLKHLMV